MDREIEVGDAVQVRLVRQSGESLKVVGKVKEFKAAYGRTDIVITGAKTEDFSVQKQSVKKL